MEYGLFEDVTQPGILLPLHRALTELFFVTENRAQVRMCPPLPLKTARKDCTSVCFYQFLLMARLVLHPSLQAQVVQAT